jgi:hypothetical protein
VKKLSIIEKPYSNIHRFRKCASFFCLFSGHFLSALRRRVFELC